MQDFRYSPMRASLHSHSFKGSTSDSSPTQHGAATAAVRSPFAQAQTDSNTFPALQRMHSQSPVRGHVSQNGHHDGSPSHSAAITRQLSGGRRSYDLPSSPYASDAAQRGQLFSSSPRRLSLDSKPHSMFPSQQQLPPDQRPSSRWGQPASPAKAPVAPMTYANLSPARGSYRQGVPISRQHSMRSNMSSLPDIDEVDSSFTSTVPEGSTAPPSSAPAPDVPLTPTLSSLQHSVPLEPTAPDSTEQGPASERTQQQQSLQLDHASTSGPHQQAKTSSGELLPSSDASARAGQPADPQPPTALAAETESGFSTGTQTPHVEAERSEGLQEALGSAARDAAVQTRFQQEQQATDNAQAGRAPTSEAMTVVDDSPQQLPALGVAAEQKQAGSSAALLPMHISQTLRISHVAACMPDLALLSIHSKPSSLL